MKIFKTSMLVTSFFLSLLINVTGQQTDPPAEIKPAESAVPEAAKSDEQTPTADQKVEDTPAVDLEPTKGAESDGRLRLNFRGVPLEMVLDYLSEAAGFIIVKETEVKGKVDVWSNQPLTKDEAVDVLNTILNKNDYAAIRNGRTLTIVTREIAKKRNIPVKKGGEAKLIPANDEMVTQIIAVRHANVAQLIANLQPLMASDAPGTMTSNESANTLIITATQAEIRRMVQIINALDESISSTSALRVFPLRYADAKELATVIKELFAPTTQQQGQGNNNNRGNQFGGGGGFPGGGGGFPGGGGGFPGGGGGFPGGGGGFPGGGGAGGAGGAGGFGGGAAGGRGGVGGGRGGGSGGGAVNARVVAVADERSNSLVVGAPDDMIDMIADVVEKIDQPVNDITELRVFHLINSDPVEVADLLASLFPDETKTGNNNNQQQFRFGGPAAFFGGGRGGQGGNSTTTTSERMKKQGRVLAVADQRTSSLVVSAASELMPQIASMIIQLDASPARKQKVFVYSLQNADAQETALILQDMFQKSTTSMNRNNANQTSPLNNRIQSNSQTTTSGQQNSGFGTGFGNVGGIGGGGQTFR
jgi:type II secretory pathway component GspD/PulD (secretin)